MSPHHRPRSLLRAVALGTVAVGLILDAVARSFDATTTSSVASGVQPAGTNSGGTTVKFGMATALTGPASSLGVNMRAGVLAAFEEANRAGGIHGRKIELLVRDDAYEPLKTGDAARDLIDNEHVLGLVGDVGTPTAVVALPICRQSKALYIGAFTGAAILRTTPPDPLVFNFRASYAQEIDAMVDALIDHGGMDVADIAFFTQRDAYGDAGFAGGMAALKRRGLANAIKPLHTRYERNTLGVESAVADILTAARRPKAIIMVGAYKPCAAFIKLCRESDIRPLFLNVSFVGAGSLALELGTVGEAGVIVTEVVPTLDAPLPLTRNCATALAALPDDVRVELSLGALEGYAVGRMVCEGLRALPPTTVPTRANLIKGLESLTKLDLGLGEDFHMATDDHDCSSRVWPSIFKGGRVVAFDWKDLKTISTGSAPGHAVADEPIRP